MSIKVFKRTREEVTPATVPATYTEWSEWIETADAPPYTNTLLMEYNIGGIEDTSDLKNLFQMFSTELKTTIQDVQSISHLEQEHFATIVSEGIVGAMNSSVNALRVLKANKEMILNNELDRELKESNLEVALATKPHRVNSAKWQELTAKENYDHAVATRQYKNDTVKWQEQLAEQNYLYAKEKAIALPKSVEFNNKVKALDSLSDLYGNHKLGGGTITSNMWGLPFGIIDQLVNGNTATISLPTSTSE